MACPRGPLERIVGGHATGPVLYKVEEAEEVKGFGSVGRLRTVHTHPPTDDLQIRPL
jgi:hypothetical protein